MGIADCLPASAQHNYWIWLLGLHKKLQNKCNSNRWNHRQEYCISWSWCPQFWVSVSKRLDSKRCFDLVKVISMRTAKRAHVCVCVGTRVEYQIKKCKIMTVPNTSNPPAIERNIRCFCPLSQRECGVHCAHNVHVTVLQKCARIRHAACSETAYIVICLSLTLSLSLSLPLKLLRNC